MKLSAVVQLIDGFSQAPAVGFQPRFLLNQKPFMPLAKPQAFYGLSHQKGRRSTVNAGP